jgi:hypothetical protein
MLLKQQNKVFLPSFLFFQSFVYFYIARISRETDNNSNNNKREIEREKRLKENETRGHKASHFVSYTAPLVVEGKKKIKIKSVVVSSARSMR